ncbi:HDOD domain-containing protein [Niveibacterium terrae]|uniref:GGDEF domain-containing response regulator n=1 Tax=Niveibacterium terrae TaxID=3373598 RepID=UPI003A901C7E
MTAPSDMLSIDLALFEQFKATGDLPSPRGVALAVMNATRAEEVSIGELANIIRTDPAFAGRLIKAANGMGTGTHRPVASIDRALMVLGLPAVRNLALGFSLLADHRKGGCAAFDYERYWSSSLIHAVAMQMLALRSHVAPPDECYCLGLLCRIGDLTLATLHPGEYAEVLRRAEAGDDLARAESERQRFSMSHAEISAAMLSGWGVPDIFAEAVLGYEALPARLAEHASRQAILTRSLGLAHQIARVCLLDAARQDAAIQVLIDCAIPLGFEAGEILELCDRIVEGWREWGALVSVATWPVPRFSEWTFNPAAPPEFEAPLPVAGESERVPSEEKPCQVLILGTDPAERQCVGQVLCTAGYEIAEASGAEQGAQLAVLSQPQLIIVSCTLPDKSGLAFVRRLRQTRIGRSIYVLGLTDHEGEEEIAEAFEAGVDDFMTRPVNSRVLLARLKASQRVLGLQREIEHGRDEIRHFAAELMMTRLPLSAAQTDSLTGFANRSGFDDLLELEWAEAVRSSRVLSCIVIELDQIARIRDETGPQGVDQALREAAAVLRAALRSRDQIARSDSEFAVLCPGTSLEDAHRVAERIRFLLGKITVGTLKLSASLGLAAHDGELGCARELFERAREMLSLAKANGHNRVCVPPEKSGNEKGKNAV